MNVQLHGMPEFVLHNAYVTAVYHMRLESRKNVVDIAERLAVGQTIGTWTKIPGITEEFMEKYVGKVVNIYDVPPCELEDHIDKEYRDYVIQIAFPDIHSCGNLPILLTCLLGNDASTSAQVKLLDIIFSQEYISGFAGPRWGIRELRQMNGAGKRPLLLNMLKPCVGITPQEGEKLFYESACGGTDIIKDDELLGSPVYSPLAERVISYKRAAKAAYEKTGSRTLYFANITDENGRMLEKAKVAVESGADGVMVNFALTGYSGLRELCRKVKVPVLAHCAGIGAYAEGRTGGMVSPLALGKLARLCGADMVMMNTPYGGYPLTYHRYIQTYMNLTLPLCGIKPTIPVIGGGVHPQIASEYIKELGMDIILAAGGAIQGHPMGCTAGVKAMRQAIACAAEGRSLEEGAQECEELRVAIKKWGKA